MYLIRYTKKLGNPTVVATSSGQVNSRFHAADGKIRFRVANTKNIYQLELDDEETERLLEFWNQINCTGDKEPYDPASSDG